MKSTSSLKRKLALVFAIALAPFGFAQSTPNIPGSNVLIGPPAWMSPVNTNNLCYSGLSVQAVLEDICLYFAKKTDIASYPGLNTDGWSTLDPDDGSLQALADWLDANGVFTGGTVDTNPDDDITSIVYGGTAATPSVTRSGGQVTLVFSNGGGGGSGGTTVVLADMPVGAVITWPVDTVPTGWLLCNGARVAEATYPELYAVLGDKYSTSAQETTDSTLFTLPDYRGRFIRGTDNGAGVDDGAAQRTARGDGTSGASISGTTQGHQMAYHSHWYYSAIAGHDAEAAERAGTIAWTSMINTTPTGSPAWSLVTLGGIGGLSPDNVSTRESFKQYTPGIGGGNPVHNATGDVADGTDTRPINISANFIIKATGTGSGSGSSAVPIASIKGLACTKSGAQTVAIAPGEGYCNGNYFRLESADSLVISSVAAGDDIYYIYVDDSESTYPTDPVFIESTTEPVFTGAKGGWYNGNDRCIGIAVTTTAAGSTLISMESTDGVSYRYPAGIPLDTSITASAGSVVWEATGVASSTWVPVSGVAGSFSIGSAHSADTAAIALAVESSDTTYAAAPTTLPNAFQLGALGADQCHATGWVDLSSTRNVVAYKNAGDSGEYVILQGFKLAR